MAALLRQQRRAELFVCGYCRVPNINIASMQALHANVIVITIVGGSFGCTELQDFRNNSDTADRLSHA